MTVVSVSPASRQRTRLPLWTGGGFRRLQLVLVTALLLAGSNQDADAAISLVRTVGTALGSSTGSTIAVTVPAAGVAVGNTVIVTIALDAASGTVSCTDSKGNAYRKDVDVTASSGGSSQQSGNFQGQWPSGPVRTVICSAQIRTALVAGDKITVTHPSTFHCALTAAAFSGFITSALDRSATGTGSGRAVSSGNVTTTQANELLIGAIGLATTSGTLFVPGNGFSALAWAPEIPGIGSVDVTTIALYRIVSQTGSYAAAGNVYPDRTWAAAIATYREGCGNGVVDAGEQCDGGG